MNTNLPTFHPNINVMSDLPKTLLDKNESGHSAKLCVILISILISILIAFYAFQFINKFSKLT